MFYVIVVEDIALCLNSKSITKCLKLPSKHNTSVKRLKGRWAGSSTLKLFKFIVPYPLKVVSSLIHLQRRHRTKRRESPLLAKEGTVEGISLSARNAPRLRGSFTCRKVGTWDRLFNFPSEGRRAEDF
jgi:hypothetical protein